MKVLSLRASPQQGFPRAALESAELIAGKGSHVEIQGQGAG
ncbi:hypothetical protein [Meiothermus granaticius]|nr:hypothetical protein [Meiothermus granaticius]